MSGLTESPKSESRKGQFYPGNPTAYHLLAIGCSLLQNSMMASPTSFDFLHGLSGQVVDEIVALDWQATPLGAPESWPIALRSQLATMLACPVPM